MSSLSGLHSIETRAIETYNMLVYSNTVRYSILWYLPADKQQCVLLLQILQILQIFAHYPEPGGQY